ncbi:MAG: 1-acyl-sn-glycerol-3-phosphate acyltransferase [Candidatus Omnitrophica bacterium]|nr:1-acyl-sn-glycerol-3-phosphate acyltransferase [Candidatus Omnitrophota bacterium]
MFLYWITRVIFRTFAKIFLRLKVEGLENIPAKGGFVLAANHASSLDPFLVTAAFPRYIRWLVIYEYYDLWFFKWFLKSMRFIRIENNLPREALRTLKRGGIVGLFPEGRRTWSGKLGPGRAGAVALARHTGCPVVPLAISGSYEALPRTRKTIKPHPITVRIGKPLYFHPFRRKEDSAKTDQDNIQILMQALANFL